MVKNNPSVRVLNALYIVAFVQSFEDLTRYKICEHK